MGDHNVVPDLDEQKLQAFMKALLDDLRALDYMLDNISLKPVSVASEPNRRCFSSI